MQQCNRKQDQEDDPDDCPSNRVFLEQKMRHHPAKDEDAENEHQRVVGSRLRHSR
jgi:hypothetical protein